MPSLPTSSFIHKPRLTTLSPNDCGSPAGEFTVSSGDLLCCGNDEDMATTQDDTAASASEGEALEQELLLRVKQQDVAALGTLLQRWRPWLLSRVRRDMGHSQPGGRRPSDLVQESCVLALRFLGDFRGDSRQELRGWLTKILHTAVEQAVRHSRANMRADARTTGLSEESAGTALRISQLVSNRQGYREVVAAVARLPLRQRDALYWRLLEGRSLAEIAERMKESEQVAASLIKRGLAGLRARLAPNEQPQKRARAERVDAALLDYLRLCDRGQTPVREDFLRQYADCEASLAPLIDWLQEVRQRLVDEEIP